MKKRSDLEKRSEGKPFTKRNKFQLPRKVANKSDELSIRKKFVMIATV